MLSELTEGSVSELLLCSFSSLFNLLALCVLCIGQAFRCSPENAFYVFNQQIYFIM